MTDNPNHPQINEIYHLNGYLEDGTPFGFSYTLRSEHRTLPSKEMDIDEARKLAYKQLEQLKEKTHAEH